MIVEKKKHHQKHTKKPAESAGHGMGGMFGGVSKKKTGLDVAPRKRSELRPKDKSRSKRLEGVKL